VRRCELLARRTLTQDEYRALRYRLRMAGAMLVLIALPSHDTSRLKCVCQTIYKIALMNLDKLKITAQKP
jgi:hypothetical protein